MISVFIELNKHFPQQVAINSDWARKTMGQLEKADEHIARHSRRRGRKRA